MNILVLNCGSSSIKYQLLNIDGSTNVLAKGQVDRIGIEGSCLEHEAPGMEEYEITTAIDNHKVGIDLILKVLIDKEVGVIQSISDINAVGHRVAHGGEMFTESKLIDDVVKKGVKDCFELAPLHNPANYDGIEAMEELLPDVPQVAVFDTAFHQTMPKHSYLYPIPYEYYKKLNVRRYGFHGTSHKFVAEKACKLLNCDINSKKIITCHLGNGASIAAIDNGNSVDTSMGFTPNDGLMMGTRSGSVDPGALLYIAKKENMSSDDLNDILNRESGVKGISQISSDMRDLANEARSGNEKAQLALKMYAHRVKKYIGAFTAVLNGLDILILTGGIGENNDYVRELCCSDMEFLGINFDSKKNIGLRGKDEEVSIPGSKVKVMILTTNEELVIAQETFRLTNS
jgi:acetate kinase